MKQNKQIKNAFKNIADKIITKELEEYNLDIKFFPITYVTYYKGIIFNVKGNLKTKIKYCLVKNNVAGTNTNVFGYDSIIIFIDSFDKYDDLSRQVVELVFTCYHEVRHSVQKHFDKHSYDSFLNNIDRVYKEYIDSTDYNINHDNYSFEIGANLYAINKTKQFLKENDEKLYNEQKKLLDEKESKYLKNYLMYNPQKRINEVLKFIKQTKQLDLIPIINCFMNDDGSFKKISEMINKENIDKEIIYNIITSPVFLDELDKSELTKDEYLLLLDALDYISIITKNQKVQLEDENEEIIKK